jgi:hypothetical protein
VSYRGQAGSKLEKSPNVMKLSSIPHSVSMIENEEALNNVAEVSDFDLL